MVTNRLNLSGRIVTHPEYSHAAYDKAYDKTFLEVKRTSGTVDTIPIIIPSALVDPEIDLTEKKVEISGYFRSISKFCHARQRNCLMLNAHASDMRLIDLDEECEDSNQIFLYGRIAKPPFYRKTPLGREIADLFLLVDRAYNKTDYIPCIAWGYNAKKAIKFCVGSRLLVYGRIQSREYIKQLSEDDQEIRTAYEISICDMEEVKSNV